MITEQQPCDPLDTFPSTHSSESVKRFPWLHDPVSPHLNRHVEGQGSYCGVDLESKQNYLQSLGPSSLQTLGILSGFLVSRSWVSEFV